MKKFLKKAVIISMTLIFVVFSTIIIISCNHFTYKKPDFNKIDLNGIDNIMIVALISFLTFRAFDIIKLFPGNYFDKMDSGKGVMLDDVVAGVYSGFLSVLLIKVFNYL